MQIFLEIYFNFTLIYCVFQYIYIKKRLFLDINLTIDVSFTNYILLLQFHPEFKSRPNRPHPLFVGLIKAAKEQ